ncbi:MAG: RNA polymerase sigma factor [Thermoanaerobaculia bacterium]|jgi:RNA polymerase sigma-70 factor (ECF subfamily)|nr:RNA polymerase sigma factor [Thermoanaerobaculia bacterium]MBP9823195.1 RNA polymerase sigma factor [Thermoanaerobaculia bacterium]
MERSGSENSSGAATVAALFESEGGRVHALARRLCGDRDADDLVQDTFLNAFRAIDQLKDLANPRPWLYAIAHRACSRMRRRRAGEPQHLEEFDELLPHPGATVPDFSGQKAGPEGDSLRTEARELVERGISALPEAFRIPLLLADIAGLRLAEIAAILDLPEATVKTRVHRARLKLRAVLAQGLPQRQAGPASQAQEICLDLLRARLAAFDHGVDFSYSDASMCERCQTVFATLALSASVCGALGRDSLPEGLRDRVLATTRP